MPKSLTVLTDPWSAHGTAFFRRSHGQLGPTSSPVFIRGAINEEETIGRSFQFFFFFFALNLFIYLIFCAVEGNAHIFGDMFSPFSMQVTIWISSVFWIQITFLLDSPFDCIFWGFFFHVSSTNRSEMSSSNFLCYDDLVILFLSPLWQSEGISKSKRRETSQLRIAPDFGSRVRWWPQEPPPVLSLCEKNKNKMRYESTETHTTPPRSK